MSKPVTPDEAFKGKVTVIPPEVFDAFNELITQRAGDSTTIVKQNEVSALIAEKIARRTGESFVNVMYQINDNRWLDIEPAYRDAGWVVNYDKPGYNESYEAFWEFRKKNSR